MMLVLYRISTAAVAVIVLSDNELYNPKVIGWNVC